MIMRGRRPKATKDVCHSYTNAMMMPDTSVEMFWIIIETVVVVTVFTNWQSVERRAVSVPALLRGISNHGMGIFKILKNVYMRIFRVMFSPT